MDELIRKSDLFQCETCFHYSNCKCSPGVWCDHGESYRPAASKLVPVEAISVDAVAEMLAKIFGDDCPCNYNDIDEWLPLVADCSDCCGDHEDPHYCWKQFIKHFDKRRSVNG